MVRRLIVNADDYGRCAEVNTAVEELITARRLRDVSVLANGRSLDSAIRFLRANPDVSVGAHLNVVEDRPVSSAVEVEMLTDKDGAFVGLQDLMVRWIRQPFAVSRAVELEWRAQLRRLSDAEIHLSHVDSHQHLHAFPLAWNLAVRLGHEFGIPALRFPREQNALPLRRVGAWALGASLAVSRLLVVKSGLRHNDHFLGFKRAGVYGFHELVSDLKNLSAGVTELALHPSIADENPYPNLFGNRERQALLNPALPEIFAELEIELTSWSDLIE
ncbi:MAG TPA: ChbG/HpnK family deacetylase [Blastocatellia bacterium]|nr:ChbG/HpnK family deacetylase [Blastocatellia bacterium]